MGRAESVQTIAVAYPRRIMRRKRKVRGDNSPGFLYFVQAGKGGPIKIGWTADVLARMNSLQTACPFDLEVLFVIGADRVTENDFHWCARKSWIRGEWFAPTPDVLRIIDEFRTGFPKAVEWTAALLAA